MSSHKIKSVALAENPVCIIEGLGRQSLYPEIKKVFWWKTAKPSLDNLGKINGAE